MSNRREEGAGEAARRRAGLRRRRDGGGALLLPRPSGLAVGAAACDDGGGRGGYDSLSSLVAAGGARLLGDGRSRKKSTAVFRRPALIFLAQALLSFVGMVVIPTRVVYELLIQPGIGTPSAGRTAAGSDESIHSLDVGGTPVIFPDPLAVRDHRAGGGSGRSHGGGGRINGDDISISQESLGVSSVGRTGARALQTETEEGEDNFTYNARTQFFLCVAEGTELREQDVRDAVVEVFDVDPLQIEEDAGTVEDKSTEFCNDDAGQAWSIEIWNEASEDKSAAEISSEQMETVRSVDFPETMAAALNPASDTTETSDVLVSAADLSYKSLGFVILYDSDQVAATSASGGLGDDFHGVAGPDQWWAWWAWLLFGLALLCCVCPLAACIYHFRPGHSGPPSPSGSGGAPVMFGKSKHGKGDVEAMGGDLNAKQFEKNGGGYGEDAGGYNDAATGISVSSDSPSEYVNPTTDSVYSATGDTQKAADGVINRKTQGEWPEALMEGGIGVAGANYANDGASVNSHQADETATVLSEADRAAGVDPNRQHQQDARAAYNNNTSNNTIATAAAALSGAAVAAVAGSSSSRSVASASVTSPRSGSAHSLAAEGSTTTSGTGGGYDRDSSFQDSAAGGSDATWTKSMRAASAMGPSGRTLGSAAAAFGQDGGAVPGGAGDEDDDDDAGEGEDMGSNLSVNQSAYSFRTDESGGGHSSAAPSSMAAEEAKAERDAYEAELATSGSTPSPRGFGAGVSGGWGGARGAGGGTGTVAASKDGEEEEESSEMSRAATLTAAAATAAAVAAAAATRRTSESDAEGDGAAAGAGATSRPPSGRSTGSGHTSRPGSYDPVAAGAAGTAAPRPRSRAGSAASSGSGSGLDQLQDFRDLTDEDRQLRMQESDAARAASLLRGSSFKVPLQPDLERAITVEEQARRRQAVQDVETSRQAPTAASAAAAAAAAAAAVAAGTDPKHPTEETAPVATTTAAAGAGSAGAGDPSPAGLVPSPPSTAASVVGKVVTGVGRFFGFANDDATQSPASAAAAANTMANARGGGAEGSLAGSATARESSQEGGGGGGVGPRDDSAARSAFSGGGGVGPRDDSAARSAFSGVPALGSTAGGDGVKREGSGEEGQGAAAAAATAAAAAAAAAQEEALLRGRSLSPEEAQAYSDNVDRTLEGLPTDDGGASIPMSELLARAELEAQNEANAMAADPGPPPPPAAAPFGAGAPFGAAGRTAGLPPPGPGQAAMLALQQQSAAGANAPSLDLARLIHNAEAGGMSLDELEASLASPIVATPPALLRPGVGASARGAASRGRGLLQNRHSSVSVSGSFVSSGSTTVTEDLMSNNALTEDDLSSDAHTTDVSRTSSYLAAGSSFEESLAQAQAASGHFLNAGGAGAAGAAAAAAAAAAGGVAGAGGVGGGALSSLAERLARAEETVGRDHEKGLLYRQGPEGVAAVVAGEELPLPPAAAAASVPAGAGAAAGGGGGARGVGAGVGAAAAAGGGDDDRVESLADILARADDGPGNLKETFRMLDGMEATRLQELNAAASADGADEETKAKWRGSLAELMVRVDRTGNLREVLDIHSDHSDSSSGSSSGSESDDGGSRGYGHQHSASVGSDSNAGHWDHSGEVPLPE